MGWARMGRGALAHSGAIEAYTCIILCIECAERKLTTLDYYDTCPIELADSCAISVVSHEPLQSDGEPDVTDDGRPSSSPDSKSPTAPTFLRSSRTHGSDLSFWRRGSPLLDPRSPTIPRAGHGRPKLPSIDLDVDVTDSDFWRRRSPLLDPWSPTNIHAPIEKST